MQVTFDLISERARGLKVPLEVADRKQPQRSLSRIQIGTGRTTYAFGFGGNPLKALHDDKGNRKLAIFGAMMRSDWPVAIQHGDAVLYRPRSSDAATEATFIAAYQTLGSQLKVRVGVWVRRPVGELGNPRNTPQYRCSSAKART